MARKVIRHYVEKGVLDLVGEHNHAFSIYTPSASALASIKVVTTVDTKVSAKAQAANKKK
jgi:hypothetical protein